MSDRLNVFNPCLKATVQAILERPYSYEWTAQGLGMLRLYLPGPENLRLHVWDSRIAVPNVSEIHTHPWDFESWVVAGVVHNTRWTEGEGDPYQKSALICGQGGCTFGAPELVRLHPRPTERWAEGQFYRQHADELHSSRPEDGTITILRRSVPAGRSADQAFVYWPAGEQWVSAEPRPATREEVLSTTRRSLERWFKGEESTAGSIQGGCWEAVPDDDGEMVRIRWSVPDPAVGYFWCAHYPGTPWGRNAAEGQAKRWNDEGKKPWEFREYRDRHRKEPASA